jgi:hypothetical protein
MKKACNSTSSVLTSKTWGWCGTWPTPWGLIWLSFTGNCPQMGICAPCCHLLSPSETSADGRKTRCEESENVNLKPCPHTPAAVPRNLVTKPQLSHTKNHLDSLQDNCKKIVYWSSGTWGEGTYCLLSCVTRKPYNWAKQPGTKFATWWHDLGPPLCHFQIFFFLLVFMSPKAKKCQCRSYSFIGVFPMNSENRTYVLCGGFLNFDSSGDTRKSPKKGNFKMKVFFVKWIHRG